MKKSESYVNFSSAEEKARYVRTMFDRISPRYDLVNRVMTFGQDVGWRKMAIRQTATPEGGRLLDIACGTGDLAFAGLKRSPSLVAAADFSLEMVKLGHQKHSGHAAVQFLGADGLNMPFCDNSFHSSVTGFSMRNVVDVDAFIAEMARVVKPGGKVVILEITPVKNRILGPLVRTFFHKIVPRIGAILGGDKEAYTYLPQSVDIFLEADELQARMEQNGLHDIQYKKLNFATVALHWGTVK